MKYKQLQMILEPTSIEKLLEEDVDNETLAEAMLFNWDHIGSLITEDDDWKCLFELSEFKWDDISTEFDSYKGREYRLLILKIKNRYFSYSYVSSMYDNDLLNWEEVHPIPYINYSVDYVDKNESKNKIINVSPLYIKLYGDPSNE